MGLQGGAGDYAHAHEVRTGNGTTLSNNNSTMADSGASSARASVVSGVADKIYEN